METKRLALREWRQSDAEAFFELCGDVEYRKSGLVSADTIEECRRIIGLWEKNELHRAAVLKESGELVGFASLGDMNRYEGYLELEYAVGARHRRKGYGTEIIKGMLGYGFDEQGCSVIAAWVRSHNAASARTLERCGFTLEGRLRRHARDKSDTLCYSMLREEWEA